MSVGTLSMASRGFVKMEAKTKRPLCGPN